MTSYRAMRKAALITAILGGLLSVMLMIHTGRYNMPALLIVLIGMWVLLPYDGGKYFVTALVGRDRDHVVPNDVSRHSRFCGDIRERRIWTSTAEACVLLRDRPAVVIGVARCRALPRQEQVTSRQLSARSFFFFSDRLQPLRLPRPLAREAIFLLTRTTIT